MKKTVFTLATLLMAMLSSCDNEDFTQNTKGADQNGFNLAYSVSKNLSATTRASIPLEEGEDNINNLYILFFEYTSGGTGLFMDAVDAKPANQQTISSSGNIKVEFPKGSDLNNQTDYNMLFCANIKQYTNLQLQSVEDFKEQFAGYTENQVMASLLHIQGVDPQVGALEEQLDNSNKIEISDLPMSAKVFKAKNENNITVELTRTLSRFDVFCQANGYELVSASVWNAYTSTLLWENAQKEFSGNRTERYYGVKAINNQIVGELYSFENFVQTPSADDTQTTSLVIGMRNLSTGDIEFFRTNLHAMNKPQELKRNNVYRTTIKVVLDKGFSSEREAYESDQVLLATDINDWTANIGGNVVYDDDHILALPTSVITLAATGDTREYKIFTEGEGTLQMTTQGIPSDVTVTLEGNLLRIEAPASSMEWSGTLTFSIGTLTNSLRIEQSEYVFDYLNLNFEVEDLPVFQHKAGSVSPDIEVTSSGAWVAEIYDGNYFSFGSSASQIAKIHGEANTTFNIHTIKENTSSETRRCFVVISLVDTPEVSSVLVLEQGIQEEEYIYFTPSSVAPAAAAHTITGITLESNTEWEIDQIITIHGGTITLMNDNNQPVTTLKGSGTKDFKINISSNTSSTDRRLFYIVVKSKGGKQALLILNQLAGSGSGSTPEPTPEKDMLFVSNGTGVGNLVAPNTSNYQWYVYGLGQNLRNSTKFGKGGTMADIKKGSFEYTSTFNATTIADAKIIQLVSNPTSADFDRIYKSMQADSNTFLMITSTNATTITNILAQFKAKTNANYGSAVTISNSPSNLRPINTAISQNSLMKYLLNNGPAGSVTASQVTLQSSVGQVGAGLPPATYPDTFVPIILSTRNNDYCVFGIDPVNRLIIMTDPGIFGAAPNLTAYPSYKNFLTEGSVNRNFLDNLTAWIINATGKDGFLKDFQKK